MEGFWTCSDCGSSNSYPGVEECEVCGKHIEDNEIKQAEQRLREAIKTQEQIKRNEEKEKKLRQQQEIEQQRKAEYERKQKEKQKLLLERRKKKAKTIKALDDVEKKFITGFFKGLKVIKTCTLWLMIAGIFVVGVSVISQDSGEIIFAEIEDIAETTVVDFVKNHYYTTPEGDEVPKYFKNIEKQFMYIIDHFEKSENVNNLTEILGW